MKLVIQIPCYNEEQTLRKTLDAIPSSVQGIDEIQIVIINDDSQDKTAEIAKDAGCHVVSHPKNFGLAKAFMTGIETALSLGADIIVNTDADNQYDASGISDLVRPILERKAEMVIGERPIDEIEQFSFLKKKLQHQGSSIVAKLSGTHVHDAPSGFRAFSRRAAEQLNVFNEYTYTLETIIQAGHRNIPIASVPIQVNHVERPSRLVKSIPSYIRRSMTTMFRVFMMYSPLRFFFYIGAVFVFLGTLPALRFVVFYAVGESSGKIQSLIFAAVMVLAGLLCFTVGLITDLIAVNRRLLEEIRVHVRRNSSNRQDGA